MFCSIIQSYTYFMVKINNPENWVSKDGENPKIKYNAVFQFLTK
jgi:hypothetical protein